MRELPPYGSFTRPKGYTFLSLTVRKDHWESRLSKTESHRQSSRTPWNCHGKLALSQTHMGSNPAEIVRISSRRSSCAHTSTSDSGFCVCISSTLVCRFFFQPAWKSRLDSVCSGLGTLKRKLIILRYSHPRWRLTGRPIISPIQYATFLPFHRPPSGGGSCNTCHSKACCTSSHSGLLLPWLKTL
jgi:hypothetical protein